VLIGFLRVVTHPRVFTNPSPIASAQGDALAKENLPTIESWMTHEQIAEAQRSTREFKPRK
jgi:hypothetical protein